MRGKHHIIIESPRLKYEFDIKRNLTILQGDSATGKTTLVDLIQVYEREGDSSPVRMESDVPCVVFSDSSKRWRQALELIQDSIIFIDEQNAFIGKKEFAEAVEGSSNYYVLITRQHLPHLPYSVREIYGIRTSGKYHFPEKIYHEFYAIYPELQEANTEGTKEGGIRLITEDSRSGHQFFKSLCRMEDRCISAEGNGSILKTMKNQPGEDLLAVIADGAAFGAYVSTVLEYSKKRKNILIYLPESFEWIILSSGIISDKGTADMLLHPEEYIDSKSWFSWEHYFTDYLTSITNGDSIRQYQKTKLRPFYMQGGIREKIIGMFPLKLQELVRALM